MITFEFSTFIEEIFNYLVDSLGSLGLGLGIIVLILIMIMQTIIAPIASEAILTAAGGIFNDAFPQGVGLLAAFIGGFLGSILGAIIAFFISRWIQKQLNIHIVKKYKNTTLVEESWVDRQKTRLANLLARFIDEESENFLDIIEEKGLLIVLIGRLLFFVPFDAISYGSGMTKIHFKDYMIATLIGTVPRVTFYVLLGAELGGYLGEDFSTFLFILLAIVIIIYAAYKLTMRYIKKYSEQQKKSQKSAN